MRGRLLKIIILITVMNGFVLEVFPVTKKQSIKTKPQAVAYMFSADGTVVKTNPKKLSLIIKTNDKKAIKIITDKDTMFRKSSGYGKFSDIKKGDTISVTFDTRKDKYTAKLIVMEIVYTPPVKKR